jgi:hypothetical protein
MVQMCDRHDHLATCSKISLDLYGDRADLRRDEQGAAILTEDARRFLGVAADSAQVGSERRSPH